MADSETPSADLNISIRRANGSTANASAVVEDESISGIFDQIAQLIVNA